jgi:hypothetical protein
LVLPFSRGGGAGGLNLQYTSDFGLGLYLYYPDLKSQSSGLSVGGSVQFNVATGRGPWSGSFLTKSAGILVGNAGKFTSEVEPDPFRNPSWDPSWSGYSVGLGKGMEFGLSKTVTQYVPLWGGR